MLAEKTDTASQKVQMIHLLADWQSRESSSILLREIGGIEGVSHIIGAPENILKTILGSRRTLHRVLRGLQKPWLEFLKTYGTIPTERHLADARNIASAFCSQSAIRSSISRQQVMDIIDTIGEKTYYTVMNFSDDTDAYNFRKEFDTETAKYDGWASYSAWRAALHPDIAAFMSKQMDDKNAGQDAENKYSGVFEMALSGVLKEHSDER